MWQCENCGYTDEDISKFDEDTDNLEDSVRYCPECGSDEVLEVDESSDDDILEEGGVTDEMSFGGSWEDEASLGW